MNSVDSRVDCRSANLTRDAAVREEGLVEKVEKGRGKVAVHRRKVRRERSARHVSTYRFVY